MAPEHTRDIIDALDSAFGEKPWLLGDSLKKANLKQAFSKALRKPPGQIRTSDLKNLVNDLWSDGLVEIIPPKDRERSFKYRLATKNAPEQSAPSSATTTEPVAEASPETPQDSNEETEILDAYTVLRKESQFRHVYISDILERSGIDIGTIHAWASQKARNREFELGQADWSLATKGQRDASIKINGVHYLTVGLLT